MPEFIDSSKAREEFSKLRNSVEKKISKAGIDSASVFLEELDEIGVKAVEGDCICQDYLSYIFKKGKLGVIPENNDLSVKWQILAGSNGNCFAIDKLLLFINSSLDKIVYHPDFGKIKYIHDLNKENYIYVLGKYICEAMADELELDPKEMLKDNNLKVPYNAKVMRKFEKAREESLPKIIKFLLTR